MLSSITKSHRLGSVFSFHPIFSEQISNNCESDCHDDGFCDGDCDSKICFLLYNVSSEHARLVISQVNKQLERRLS